MQAILSSPLSSLSVTERVEKLEVLMAERTNEPSPVQLQVEASSSVSGTPVGAPGALDSHGSATPSRKVKIKNGMLRSL